MSQLTFRGEVVLQGPQYRCVLSGHKSRLTLNVPSLKAYQELRAHKAMSAEQRDMLVRCLETTDMEFALAVRNTPILVIGSQEQSNSRWRRTVQRWLGIPEHARLSWRTALSFWKDLL